MPVKLGELFEVEDSSKRASTTMAQAANTMGGVRPGSTQETSIEKTAGGALMNTAGGAAAGAATAVAAMGEGATVGGTSAGWWGAGIGALIGLGAYMLS